MTSINKVYTVSMDVHPDARIFFANFTFPTGETEDEIFVSYPDPTRVKGQPNDLNQMFQDWLEDNEGRFELLPYEPEVLTPEEIRASYPKLSRRQLLLALLHIDITEAMVDAAVGDDPTDRIEWDNATSFDRLHPLIEGMSVVFNLPADQVDNLWVWASGL